MPGVVCTVVCAQSASEIGFWETAQWGLSLCWLLHRN